MRARRALAAAALVSLLAGCSAGAPGQEPAIGHRLDAATATRLDAAIGEAMTTARIPGALVGVWSPDGDYVKAFGVADTATQTPMRTELYSRIGSVTKTFTATAVLMLVEQGAVALDDPVSRYLSGVPDGDAITVDQLIGMRSGLVDYTKTDAFVAAMSADPRREFTPAELLGWSFAQPAAFPPGERVAYSNTNYILLGLLVEKVSGQPFADYLDEHILSPLGMANTSLPAGSRFPEPHPRGYTEPLAGEGPPVDASGWSTSFAWAAGSLVSTLEDLRVWVPALATGTLLTPELQQQRLRTTPEPGAPDDFGYGGGLFTVAGWIGHNGSVPGYQTVALYLPERQVTLVVMINTDVAPPGGRDPSEALTAAITAVLTPGHVYRL